MEKTSLLNPTVGLERIDHYVALDGTLPAAHDAELVGTRPIDNLSALYDRPSVVDNMRALITPVIDDPSLLTPAKFEAALLDAIDKLAAKARRDDCKACREAARHLKPMREAREKCWENILALSKV